MLLALIGEGRLSCEEFVHKHSNAPDIDFVVVVLAVANFRRDVV